MFYLYKKIIKKKKIKIRIKRHVHDRTMDNANIYLQLIFAKLS